MIEPRTVRGPNPRSPIRRVGVHAVSYAAPTPVVIDRGESWVRVRVELPDGRTALYVITSAAGGPLDCVRTDLLQRDRPTKR